MLSKLLRKDRSFDIKNVKKYVLLYCNKYFWQLYCAMLIKKSWGSNMYKLYLAVFLRAAGGQNGTFFYGML